MSYVDSSFLSLKQDIKDGFRKASANYVSILSIVSQIEY